VRSILADIYQEGLRLVAEAAKANIKMRLLGGLAVRYHSPSAVREPWKRFYQDIDVVIAKAAKGSMENFMTAQGYESSKIFNALNGHERQLYFDGANKRQLDVFVSSFNMCHKIPLEARLVEEVTIPLADILLTKMQIVELNPKDVTDITTLLLDHQVGSEDGEVINGSYIASLCAADWGLSKTIAVNIAKIKALLSHSQGILPEQGTEICSKLDLIQLMMDREPKSLAWRMRDKIGEKVKWYNLPEEVQR
jgi:hypothetical protein